MDDFNAEVRILEDGRIDLTGNLNIQKIEQWKELLIPITKKDIPEFLFLLEDIKTADFTGCQILLSLKKSLDRQNKKSIFAVYSKTHCMLEMVQILGMADLHIELYQK